MLNKEIFYPEATRIIDDLELLFTTIKDSNFDTQIEQIEILVKELLDNAIICHITSLENFIGKIHLVIKLIHHQYIQFDKKVEEAVRTAIGILETLSFNHIHSQKLGHIHEELYNITNHKLDAILKFMEGKYEFKAEAKLNSNEKVILFVDDSILIRKICEKVALLKGYKVFLANDGLHGLRLAMNNNFDLICSDINMPKVDGLIMINEIRTYEKFRFTPIIMLTTERDQNMVNFAKSLGVKSWLTKPFTMEKLEYTFEKVLGI